MARFRKRPVEVEAIQWLPGVTVPGLEIRPTEIHYSYDGLLYYITRGDERPTHWLEVRERPGPVPSEQQKLGGLFTPQWAQFNLGDGRVYHRKAWPFTTWKVDSRNGKTEVLDENTDLFKDYASLMHWSKDGIPLGFVTTIQGQRVPVHIGEWVIAESDGVHHYPCAPDEFDRIYEPVSEITP